MAHELCHGVCVCVFSAKELELEDRHSRLEQRLRECMTSPGTGHGTMQHTLADTQTESITVIENINCRQIYAWTSKGRIIKILTSL